MSLDCERRGYFSTDATNYVVFVAVFTAVRLIATPR